MTDWLRRWVWIICAPLIAWFARALWIERRDRSSKKKALDAVNKRRAKKVRAAQIQYEKDMERIRRWEGR